MRTVVFPSGIWKELTITFQGSLQTLSPVYVTGGPMGGRRDMWAGGSAGGRVSGRVWEEDELEFETRKKQFGMSLGWVLSHIQMTFLNWSPQESGRLLGWVSGYVRAWPFKADFAHLLDPPSEVNEGDSLRDGHPLYRRLFRFKPNMCVSITHTCVRAILHFNECSVKTPIQVISLTDKEGSESIGSGEEGTKPSPVLVCTTTTHNNRCLEHIL